MSPQDIKISPDRARFYGWVLGIVLACGGAWWTLSGDVAHAKECARRAESKADAVSDWFHVLDKKVERILTLLEKDK